MFTVSSDLVPRLVVPFNKSTGFKGFESKLISSEEFWGHKKDEFQRELENIDIQNSYFSNEDVGLISDYIMERM